MTLTTKEFSVRVEDRPGILGHMCSTLADRGVNILAFQACPLPEKKTLMRLVVDNPATAKKAFDSERLDFAETEVVQIPLANRPGALAQAASRLGEAKININYGYCGVEPHNDVPVLIFGVEDVGKASKILAQAVAATA